jgi:glycosyltransferase involved in cell wall biosynthesis
MNILFLTLNDFKDLEDRSIYTDLLNEFLAAGHSLTIVSPRERKYGERTRLIESERCRIAKVRIGNIQKTNTIERGLSTLFLEYQVARFFRKSLAGERYDLVLYSTPPITFTRIVWRVKRDGGAVSYLMLKDIFPQNAVDLDLLREGGWLHRYFRRKEKRLYAVSDHIGCMSEANVRYLLEHEPWIPPGAVEVCPNGLRPRPAARVDRAAVRARFGVPADRSAFICGGNFGKPQGIPFIIEALRNNQAKPDRHFILCGSGTEWARLARAVGSFEGRNITMIPGLPKAEFDDLVSACDVGLVFLDHRFMIPNFPSRMLTYMENGIPVLAATDPHTDLGEAILSGRFGWWCESADPAAFTVLVDEICRDPVAVPELGANARRFFEDHYTARLSYRTIMRHFDERG